MNALGTRVPGGKLADWKTRPKKIGKSANGCDEREIPLSYSDSLQGTQEFFDLQQLSRQGIPTLF